MNKTNHTWGWCCGECFLQAESIQQREVLLQEMEMISQMANQESRQKQEDLTRRAEELEIQVGCQLNEWQCVLLCTSTPEEMEKIETNFEF